MKSDLTCPVEVVSVRIGQEKQEQEAKIEEQLICVIEFFNLSEKVIDSIQMNIICYAADGSRVGGRLVRSSARGEGRARFSGAFMPEHVDGTTHVEASVEKVWFRDGVIWRREERNVREYTPNTLPEGRELDRLRAVAGEDAMGYAREDDIVWMCVCGRANRTSDAKCLRCERDRVQVLQDYSFTAIDSTVGRRERMLEQKTMETMRRSSEETVRRGEDEQKRRRRSRRRVRTVIVLLVLLIIALLAVRWGIPYAGVEYARYVYHEGRYADAKEISLWVDRYWKDFGAADLANQAEESIIRGLIDNNTDLSLQSAAERAQALDTPDASALAERAVLARAQLAIDNGEDAKAEELLTGLTGSETAKTMLTELIYRIASDAMKQTNYPLAIERFTSLGDYGDAAAQIEECTYLYGRQLLREGRYAEACDQFLKVSGRPDAVSLIRQSRYALAGEKMEAGDYVEAAGLYESLGVYEEAETRAKYCRYTEGLAQLEAGHLEAAVAQLRLAEDYEDAAALMTDASFTLGSTAIAENRFADAISWLERLKREGEIAEAYERAVYAYARQLEDAGQLEPAVQQFALVGEYEDAARRITALEYELAVREMDKSPEAALARFEALGSYQDSEDMARECRYRMAAAAYDADEFESALEQFEALGKYGDSASQAQRSRYALAAQLSGEGSYAQAAELYAACGVYLDAEERTMRARYDMAAALQAEENYEAASAAFAALGSYDDAKLRTRTCEDAWLSDVYTEAKMDYELGDYDSVIEGLEPYWQCELPLRYQDIMTMYREACILRGEELIEMNRPLDALPVLERITDSDRVDRMLGAYVYRIFGRWKDPQGVEYIFRRDGSCSIAGKEGYFGGRSYDLYIGEEPYPTTAVFSFVDVRKAAITLRRVEDRKHVRLTYVGEAPEKIAEEAEETEQAAEDAAAQKAEAAAEETADAVENDTAVGTVQGGD